MNMPSVLDLAPAVEYHAQRVRRRIPANSALASLDDLRQEAWVAACEAAARYDPAEGASLRTYADHRIEGRLLDYLRVIDPLKRQHRKAIQRGEAEAPRMVNDNCLYEMPHQPEQETITLARECISALEAVAPRERRLIETTVIEGASLSDAAAELNLKLSRACQLRVAGLKRLRELLRAA